MVFLLFGVKYKNPKIRQVFAQLNKDNPHWTIWKFSITWPILKYTCVISNTYKIKYQFPTLEVGS